MTGKSDIAVRIASQRDLDAIAAIYAQTFDGMAQTFGGMRPRLAVEQYLRPEGAWALIATLDRGGAARPAGFVLARTVLEESEIFSIGVAPADRRRGVGEALVATARQIAERGGAAAIYLEVGVDNPGARALYEKCGFDVVGRRPDYYRKSGGDRVAALILRLSLGTRDENKLDLL
jgi:ribosomal-protein-alanine N-acetyltransferase